MKILKLNFKNLASLAGTWSIDFTDPNLTRNGIFAIIGETASGKTTIFDAVCLALYGQTPRLSDDSIKGNTKAFGDNRNEIMTIGTQECYAEVILETEINGSNERFKFKWNQTRYFGKSNKLFNSATREISHELIDGWHQLNNIKKAEDLTGLSFRQFTQAAMLSQGEFTRFLEAAPEARAELLEKMTGTSIYKEIAKRAHALKSNASSRIEYLENQIAGLTKQKDELNFSELKSQKLRLENEKSLLEQKEKNLTSACSWRQGIIELEKNASNLLGDKQQLELSCKEFEPQRSRLERALKALELAPAATQLAHARDIFSKNSENKTDTEKELTDIKKLSITVQEELTQIAAELDTTIKQEKELRNKIETVRPLDAKIKAQKELADKGQKEISDASKALKQAREEYSKAKDKLNDIKTSLSDHDKYVNYNAIDEELQTILSGIASDNESIKKQLILKRGKVSSQDKLNKAINRLAQEKNEALQKSGDISHKLKTLSDTSAQLIKELETEKDKFSGKDANKAILDIHTRNQKISAALQHCEKWLESQARLIEYQNNINLAENKARQINEQIASQEKLRDSLADAIDNAQLYIDTQNRLDALADSLKEGEACPLCGSIAHPHPHEKSADTLQAEIKITANKAAKKEAENQITILQKHLADQNTAINTNTSLKENEQKSLLEFQQALAPLEKELALNEICPDNASLWHNALQNASAMTQQAKDTLESAFNKIQTLEKDISELKTEQTALEKEQENQKNIITSSEKLIEANQETLNTVQAELQSIEQEITEKWQSIADILSKFHCHIPMPCDTEILDKEFATLKQRSHLYKDHKEKAEQLAIEKAGLENELKNKATFGKKAKEDLDKRESELAELAEGLRNLQKQRFNIFGEQNADDAEQKMRSILQDKQKNQASKEKEAAGLQVAIEEKEKALEKLSAELLKSQKEATALEQLFSVKLRDKGFNNEEEYQASALTEDEISNLKNEKDELDRQSAEINGLIENNNKKLQQEQQKNVSALTLDEIKEELENVKQTLSNNSEKLGGIEKSFELIEKFTNDINELKAELEERKSKLTHFDKLKALLGNADGSTFNEFAQGITFEILLEKTNRHLHHFDDRYTLRSKGTGIIDFTIIDSMQGNMERTASNLSGGEKFLVSLSLALGLSELASEKVSIDTLFIDEGFGTLSEDYLNTVLNALTTLKNDNKTIGVISHVEQLKNVITQHISLRKLGGGLSEIITSGPNASPGCKKLS